jgi:hypothetical protein
MERANDSQESVTLISEQLTSRMIIDEAQQLRKKSQRLRHKSRNIRGVSQLWMEMSEALIVENRSLRVKVGMKDTQTLNAVDQSRA